MISNRPYLLRAFHQWIVDSQCTPILVIDANNPFSKIPKEYIESNEIVFNISEGAIRDLKITNQLIEFKASFSGVVHLISAPIKAILAVYAEENGEGIFFDAEEDDEGGNSGQISNITPFADPTSAASISEAYLSASENQITDPSSNKLIKGKPFLKLVE
jgi:stringent starvation protein B